MKIWILDETSIHIATVTGQEDDVIDYVNTFSPSKGIFDKFKIDLLGPKHVNANFDFNPDAEEVNL